MFKKKHRNVVKQFLIQYHASINNVHTFVIAVLIILVSYVVKSLDSWYSMYFCNQVLGWEYHDNSSINFFICESSLKSYA